MDCQTKGNYHLLSIYCVLMLLSVPSPLLTVGVSSFLQVRKQRFRETEIMC